MPPPLYILTYVFRPLRGPVKGSLISCIVPVFNGERYLGEALDSILSQTYRLLEIIIVDDGSTDETAAVIAEYGDQVRYLRQTNSGPWVAQNLGLSLAQGKFVAFLDADDLWHPEKLTRQMARFKKSPGLDICVTYVQNFWIPELREEEERFREHRLSKPLPGYVTPALLARLSCFDKIGLFNSTLQHAAAADWFMRAAEQRAVMEMLPDVLVYRRLHKTNRSRRLAVASRAEYLKLLKTRLDHQRHRDLRSLYPLDNYYL